jgi:hypothetical protein
MHHVHIPEPERIEIDHAKLMQAADEMLRAVAAANAGWRLGRRGRRTRRPAFGGAVARRRVGRRRAA